MTSVIFFSKGVLPESDNEETSNKPKLKGDGIQMLQDYERQKLRTNSGPKDMTNKGNT